MHLGFPGNIDIAAFLVQQNQYTHATKRRRERSDKMASFLQKHVKFGVALQFRVFQKNTSL